MSKGNSSISFGLGLLGGILGGIAAGVLFAPKPGEETRKEIAEAVKDLAEKHAPEIKNAKKQALDSIDLVKYQLEKQYQKLNDSLKAKNLAKAKEKEFNSDELN